MKSVIGDILEKNDDYIRKTAERPNVVFLNSNKLKRLLRENGDDFVITSRAMPRDNYNWINLIGGYFYGMLIVFDESKKRVSVGYMPSKTPKQKINKALTIKSRP